MPKVPVEACLELATRSRRARRAAEQAPRRQRECAVRRRAVRLARTRRQRGRLARRLGVAPRTLRGWRQRDRCGWKATQRGRPCKESTFHDKWAALELLASEGPHLGLPTLRAALPQVPRCQWIELQRDFRDYWKEQHRCGTQELSWHRAGAVWAVDFSDAPQPIDHQFGKILAVRDLASGMQLNWRPVIDETTATAVACLKLLFEIHGAPIVLKSDNGSAFISADWRQLLRDWRVESLYSPPRTPRYNGGCEAGNGSLKVRTSMIAHANGRTATWTGDDLEAARNQANWLTRRNKPTDPTPADRWNDRDPITSAERDHFKLALDEQRAKFHNQLEEAQANKQLSARQAARQERTAINLALQELGLLTVTWRSIPLPLNLKKAARFM